MSKRKREDSEDGQVTFKLAQFEPAAVGPVLASFPALVPPKSTSFKCYALKNRRPEGEDDNDAFTKRPLFVAGESDSVEFCAKADDSMQGCTYLLGVRNKRTNVVTIRPAPLKIFSRTVKALKPKDADTSTPEDWREARNNLGEAFGTVKAVKAIRAAERNKVDVTAMQDIAGYLQENIQANTSALPTMEEAKAQENESRLIPPYNANAEAPADVYSLHDIVPEIEFASISVKAILGVPSIDERLSLLPYRRSEWLSKQLVNAFAANKPKKKTLKILFYISALMLFRRHSEHMGKLDAFRERMRNTPEVVVDGLISRFTETARGASPRVTPQTQQLLLTYMFALCLIVDDFTTDYLLIAADLSMSSQEVKQLFRSLGCSITELKTTDVKRLNLPDSAEGTKRAVLKLPLQFPKQRRRRNN